MNHTCLLLFLVSMYNLSCQTVVLKNETLSNLRISNPTSNLDENEIESSYDRLNNSKKPSLDRPIDIFIDELPDGLVFTKGNLFSKGKISVNGRYKHIIIGSFRIDVYPKTGMSYLFANMEYESEEARKWCNIQTPLKWITIGIWMALPPFWPCFPEFISTKEQSIEDIKRLANLVNANAVIASVKTVHGERSNQYVKEINGYLVELDSDWKKYSIKNKSKLDIVEDKNRNDIKSNLGTILIVGLVSLILRGI